MPRLTDEVISDMLGERAARPMPVDLTEAVLASVRAAQASGRTRRQRSRFKPLLLVAAALAIGASAAIVVFSGSLPRIQEPPTQAPTPTASPAEPSPSGSAALPTLPRECAEIEAGTYRAAIGPASITMSVPTGWNGSSNGDAFRSGDGFGLGSRSCLLAGGVTVGASMVSRVSASVCDGKGTTVDTDRSADVIAALAAQIDHRTTTGPTEDTIGGYPASRFDFSTGGGPEPCNTGPLWWTPEGKEGPGMHYGNGSDTFLTVYVVDLDGSPLAIAVDSGYPDTPAEVAELDAIVASLRIEP